MFPDSGQSPSSVKKNAAFFDQNEAYIHDQGQYEIHRLIRLTIEREVKNAGCLLDVGNGGFFNYQTDSIEELVAVDLMVQDGAKPAANITFRRGSILALPFENCSFDCVLVQSVLHHVTGQTVSQNRRNMAQAIRECARVLKPGGKLVLLESTVPSWFYQLIERPLYRLFARFWPLAHPLTFQYTRYDIVQELNRVPLQIIEQVSIPRGQYVIQFGYVVPTFLTPIQAIKFVAIK
jgi:SAM-dependent methyltransferase